MKRQKQKPTTMSSIEVDIVKTRLSNLLKQSIDNKQVDMFLKQAESMNMSPEEAMELLEKGERRI